MSCVGNGKVVTVKNLKGSKYRFVRCPDCDAEFTVVGKLKTKVTLPRHEKDAFGFGRIVDENGYPMDGRRSL